MNNNILFDRLNKAAVMLELKKGSVLFHPGDPVMGVYVVREGRIILTWPRERKLFQMYIAERGEVVGLFALRSREYQVTAFAASESHLGFVEIALVTHLLECYPDVNQAAMNVIAEQLRRMQLPCGKGFREA